MSDLKLLAEDIWHNVCKNISLILEECDLHGLSGVLVVPDPSLESRIKVLKKLDIICQLIIDSTDDSGYSVARIMYNAKQQILNLEMLLTAAKNHDENLFNEAKNRLNNQSEH